MSVLKLSHYLVIRELFFQNFIQGSGTSEATAHTSGLVATLLSAGYRTPREIKAKIICLSVNVPRIIERLEDPRGTTIRLIQAPRPLFG
jgi:subtilisin family serine protease